MTRPNDTGFNYDAYNKTEGERAAERGWGAQIHKWSTKFRRNDVPGILRPFTRKQLEFRDVLFTEERTEYAEALGTARRFWDSAQGFEDIVSHDADFQHAMAKVADGIADQIFLLLGDAAELGMGHVIDRVIQRVIDANMAKLGADGEPIINGVTEGYRLVDEGLPLPRVEKGFRSDLPIGKVLKPEGWESPDADIERMLFP